MTPEDLNRKRLDNLMRHINNVRSNTMILGENLIERGEVEFGRFLIANGLIHDNSKFSGIEWDYLHSDIKETHPEQFRLAADNHVKLNKHHPEAWGHINEMPRLYVAELVCDIVARSSEFGNNVFDWLSEKGYKKYEISKHTKKAKEIGEFLKLLLEKPFK